MSGPDAPLVVVAGPTASGKSALALELAHEFGGEIVCCDALQIYRGMDIGTAKPTAAERAAVPHHMLDLRDPTAEFSAGDYQRLGRAALDGIRCRGRVPIVVGGTGFYLRALLEGLFEGPGRSDWLRARLRRIADRRGSAGLHRILRRVDPGTAARIAPADLPRLVRACEVYWMTGRPLSWWHERAPDRLSGFRWLKLAIARPRPELYRRVDLRVDGMFAAGFVDEVQRLVDRCGAAAPAFKGIGYNQIHRALAGLHSLERAREETKRETRRYAKRQGTWFRCDPDIRWLDASCGEASVMVEARAAVQQFLDGREAAKS
jgi:tRNA dimethylallyltransferase